MLVSPQNYVIPHAFSLTKSCSNNVAKYNALLIRVKNLKSYGDSKLIVKQVRGEYEVRHEDLVPYHNATITWLKSSEASTSTIYHANRMHMHWHLSPLHWLFQPERQRKYSYTVLTCTVRNSSLKIVILQKESFKSMRFLRLQRVQNSGLAILIHRLYLIRHIS